MTVLVYDAGALIAAGRNDRRLWALHRRANARGEAPLIPVTALAQAWRGPDPWLGRLLTGCRVSGLSEAMGQRIGELLAITRTNDIVDAHVVLTAVAVGGTCVTSDRRDLSVLAAAARQVRPSFTRFRMPIIDI